MGGGTWLPAGTDPACPMQEMKLWQCCPELWEDAHGHGWTLGSLSWGGAASPQAWNQMGCRVLSHSGLLTLWLHEAGGSPGWAQQFAQSRRMAALC